MYQQPVIDTSPKISDEVRQTTCYMCACRCGINVHMKDGKVAYIEGNRNLPSRLMRQHDLNDGDWARVTSPHGEITVPVMEMAALNDNTVWTWSAIGKLKGA